MTVPAKRFVGTNPSVLPVGGADLVLNGMFLTNNSRVPIGTVLSFPDATSVGNFFGAGSTEALEATVYFLGWDGSVQKPGSLLFTQYPSVAVAAYLRGGNISAVPLATLQGYNGTLAIVVDGIARSGAVNLSGATSQSNAASLIATALNTSLATIASFTAAIAGNIMTVSAVSSGTLAIGQRVSGAGITGNPNIVSQQPGGTPGGAGTYVLSGAGLTVGSEAMTTAAAPVTVTYDSVSGAFIITSGAVDVASTIAYPTTSTIASNLLLTQITGAILSQGAAAATPAAFMNSLIATTQNWISFTTLFNPDASGFANKLLFTQWCNGIGVRYLYVPADIDPNAAAQQPGIFTGYGAALQAGAYNGTCPQWEQAGGRLCAFLMGMVASIDFDQNFGRVSFAAKSQAGLVPGVTDDTSFLNLAGDPLTIGSFGNGYNCYSAIASANANFQWYQRSTMPGAWKWVDGYVNAVWLDNTGQVAILTAFGQFNAIPFNARGANILRTVLQPVIQQGLAFGMFEPGVVLTGAQIASVNAVAGADIATTLQNVGYYLLIKPATPAVRSNRGPWQIILYYTDAGAVQAVNFGTVAIQ